MKVLLLSNVFVFSLDELSGFVERIEQNILRAMQWLARGGGEIPFVVYGKVQKNKKTRVFLRKTVNCQITKG